MDKRSRLKELYEQKLSLRIPDSSGGGSRELWQLFCEIVQWDTFVAGMVSSYLKVDKKKEHVAILHRAAIELPTIISLLDTFQPKTEREDQYRTTYKNWTISLLNLIIALKECYRIDDELPQEKA